MCGVEPEYSVVIVVAVVENGCDRDEVDEPDSSGKTLIVDTLVVLVDVTDEEVATVDDTVVDKVVGVVDEGGWEEPEVSGSTVVEVVVERVIVGVGAVVDVSGAARTAITP